MWPLYGRRILLRCKELEFSGFQPQLVGRRVQPTVESSRSSGPSPLRDGEDSAVRFAGDGDDESIQDGSLSRCHNRSVSHDSYFRLLMTSRTGSMQVDPLDEEVDASPEASACQPGQSNDAIYAEISKSGTKTGKCWPYPRSCLTIPAASAVGVAAAAATTARTVAALGGRGRPVWMIASLTTRPGLRGAISARVIKFYTKPLVLSYPCVDYCCLVRKLRKAVKGAGKESAPRNRLPPRSRLRSQELAPEREPVLDQGPADEEEPIAEIEKETANEEPPVKAKPAFNLRKVTVRLDGRLALNPDGSTKAKKKKAQDADLKGGCSPPEKRRRMTRSTAKVGCSSDGQVTDDEVTRYFARKKIGLTNAKLRHRGPRISKGHPSMAPKKKRFSFKDHVFQIIPLVKPKNARNLCPASLSSLLKRFPLLSDHCNVVEADKEWRSHVNMPIDYFEIDSSQSTFAFFNMMDVEFYWNRVFAAKLPNGEPQFPTLKYVFPSYFLCRAERFFSFMKEMKLAKLPYRFVLS
ncbi:hypothetical protein DAPPUDRAFT_115212 [Daphnia pulex]|uniref:Uncharacterized protein n=1 Tax=Daphnia pulex TaxID=6669 RepID=E9HKL3_DAPPU|nr:hypothetical protein DAPPUDRAFT_115212 [Daphnia pulex]|eukprot:EFX67717.1 hypothetical protein DAPPUDRAFT_115212 [Daphnia pulex]